jgi:hypothetical protein
MHTSPQFWEQLGRAMAAFGFLEKVLKGAIFVFQATRIYSDDEIENANKQWQENVGKILGGQLSDHAEKYRIAAEENQNATARNINELVEGPSRFLSVRFRQASFQALFPLG